MGRLKKYAAALAAALALIINITAPTAGVTASAYTQYVSEPRASVTDGVYETNKYVRLTTRTSGARIYYTLDGSEPTTKSREYVNAIPLKGEEGESVYYIIRAFAVKSGYEDSDIVEFEYYIEIPPAKEVIFIDVVRTPSKTRYSKGEALDLTGGRIRVTYDDRTYENITMTNSMVSGFNSNTAGEKTITVTYQGYTDEFEVTVTDTSGGESGDSSDPELDEEDELPGIDDIRPRIYGTEIIGWEAIEAELKYLPQSSDVIIQMYSSVSVPSTLIRTAKASEMYLTFLVNDEMYWELDTTQISIAAIPNLGLGIRTTAMSVSQMAISEQGGTAANIFHINSDNKAGAKLFVETGRQHYNKFASLFRYDSETREMTLADTAQTDIAGNAVFTPKLGGDYVIIIDSETKIKGDLNNNMKVDASDVEALLKMIIVGPVDDDKYDINGDGAVNARDMSMMLRIIVA